MVRALRCISGIESSSRSTTVLNDAEKYLNNLLLKPIEGNDEDFLQENFNRQPLDIFYSLIIWGERGVRFHQEISDLSFHQQKEVIALGYYLKGKLNTEEELDYIENVLRSYLKTIEQFRSPQRPQ